MVQCPSAMKKARKHVYKKCVVVLICLLIAGNLTHGAVLCLGSGDHIEIESAFHNRCGDHSHYQQAKQKRLSDQNDHITARHCEPCVDVPITIGMTKRGRTIEQLNSTFQVPAAKTIVPDGRFNNSAYSLGSNIFDPVSYFVPLRAIILLI